MNRGQIQIASGVIVAVLTLLGSIGTARITANSSIKDEVASVRQGTAVNATRIDNLDNRLDRLENKIDWLVQRQGGNPVYIDNRFASSTQAKLNING